jgi:hypothetical protein
MSTIAENTPLSSKLITTKESKMTKRGTSTTGRTRITLEKETIEEKMHMKRGSLKQTQGEERRC